MAQLHEVLFHLLAVLGVGVCHALHDALPREQVIVLVLRLGEIVELSLKLLPACSLVGVNRPERLLQLLSVISLLGVFALLFFLLHGC